MPTATQGAAAPRLNMTGLLRPCARTLKALRGHAPLVRRLPTGQIQIGLSPEAAKHLSDGLTRQLHDNPLFANFTRGTGRVVGSEFAGDLGQVKHEIRQLRDLIDADLQALLGDAPLKMGTAKQLIAKSYQPTIVEPGTGDSSDVHIEQDPAPGREVMARIPLVRLQRPDFDLEKALVDAIEQRIKEEAARREPHDEEERETIVRRNRQAFKTARDHADNQFHTLVSVLRDNILGKIKREIGLLFLHRLAGESTGAESKLYRAYLGALQNLRNLCDDSAVPDEVFILRNDKIFGSREVNLRNTLNLADAFDFLPIACSVRGLIHEERLSAPAEVIIMASGVKTKFNGKSAGLGKTSLELQADRLAGEVQAIWDEVTSADGTNDLSVSRFAHRLAVLAVCCSAITNEQTGSDTRAMLKRFKNLWATPPEQWRDSVAKLVKWISSRADKFDEIGKFVRTRLRDGGKLELSEKTLHLSVSSDVIDHEGLERGQPVLPPPMPQYDTTYMRYVTVSPTHKPPNSLVYRAVAVRIAQTNLTVGKGERRSMLLQRAADLNMMAVRICASPQVAAEVAEANPDMPVRSNVCCVFSETPDGIDQNLWIGLQGLLIWLSLEAVTRRQDRLVEGEGASGPTPVLLMRYSQTDGEWDGGDPEGADETRHDACVRQICKAIEFTLGNRRLVLSQGFCIKRDTVERHRMRVAAYAAFSGLDCEITTPGNVPAAERMLLCAFTSAKSDGTFGVELDEDRYLLHGEIYSFDRNEDGSGLRVRLRRRFAEVARAADRFRAIGDAYAGLKDLYEREGYRHCLFISRSPYSELFGITREREPHFGNAEILSTMSDAMPGLTVYPLLCDTIHAVRRMKKRDSRPLGGCFRVLDGNIRDLLSPLDPQRQSFQSVLNVVTIGTYTVIQESDETSVHSGFTLYNTPGDVLTSVFGPAVARDLVEETPMKRTVGDVLTALHLFRSQKNPQGSGARQLSFVLNPLNHLLGSDGQSYRTLTRLPFKHGRQRCQVQYLAVLYRLRDFLDRIDEEAGFRRDPSGGAGEVPAGEAA